jgi:hypothetical protein
MNALIAFAFFLGTLSPLLPAPAKSPASTSIPAEVAALGHLLGESADSLSTSFCQLGDEAPAGNQGEKHHGEQKCCLCQALADLLHALPPADGSGLIAAQAGGKTRAAAPSLPGKRRFERAGWSRAPPALFEVSAV